MRTPGRKPLVSHPPISPPRVSQRERLLRKIHPPQEGLEAGVGAEEDQAISMKELERDATDAVQELVGETRPSGKGLY